MPVPTTITGAAIGPRAVSASHREVTEPTPQMQTASQGAIDKSVQHSELDPVLRTATFTVIDRSAEARTIQIEVPRA